MTGRAHLRLRWRPLAAAGAALALLISGCSDPTAAPSDQPSSTSAWSAPSSPSQPESPAATEPLAPSDPAWLEIPAIGVRTDEIIDLGLEPDGSLEVPEDAVTAGWFDRSPAPGEVGPSIIAGHVDYDHVPGVFYRLHELPVGSEVTVHRADGSRVLFTVDKVQRYPKSEFPTELVYGNTDKPELRLITCGGAFDSSSGNYVDNVIAFATMTGVQLS